MSDVSRGPSAPGKGKARTVVLVVSLGLNLLVAGMAVGAWMHGPPGPRDGRDLGFGPFDEVFRPEDRLSLRDAVRARAGDLRAARSQMSTDMQAVISALRAEPFDPAALKAALARQQDNLTRRIGIGTEVITDYLSALPAERRAEFADRIEEKVRRGKDMAKD